jgi:hypothetical protein
MSVGSRRKSSAAICGGDVRGECERGVWGSGIGYVSGKRGVRVCAICGHDSVGTAMVDWVAQASRGEGCELTFEIRSIGKSDMPIARSRNSEVKPLFFPGAW